MSTIKVGETNNVLDNNSRTFDERALELEEMKRQEEEEQRRLKGSPFRSWVQVNKDAYKAEDWLMAKSPIAYRIFKFLINNMDSYNAVMCSQTVLQETFDISRITVSRAIKLLKDKNYIDIYKSGTSNVYTVNKQVAWNSWGSNYKHGKFSANIIISESEQEQNSKVKIEAIKHKEVKIKDGNN